MSGRNQRFRGARDFRIMALAVVLAAALVVTGCSNDKDKAKSATKDDKKTESADKKPKQQVSKKMTSTAVLGVDVQFKTFSGLVKTANLTDMVNDDELTLFVPNTEAFDALEDGVIDDLSKDPDELAKYLKRYMVKGTVTINDLVNKNDTELETLAGTKLKVGVDDKTIVSVDGAKIIKIDIATSNATIHVIDTAFAP